jgi:hypothetical protein
MNNAKDYIRIIGLKLAGMMAIRPISCSQKIRINEDDYIMIYAFDLDKLEPCVVLEKHDYPFLKPIIDYDKNAIKTNKDLSDDPEHGKIWHIDCITNKTIEGYEYPIAVQSMTAYIDFLQQDMNLRTYTVAFYASELLKDNQNAAPINNDWIKNTNTTRDNYFKDIFGV